uniref:Tripeptidyl peptidase II second Ig-like domain-containing protein n=1 Tax=Cucumis melo TaxID=3656 RepID=A0A9I9E283_CUCME
MDRDGFSYGKQILSLTLTRVEDGVEVKPTIPLFNDRIYDNKFESQFYMISDTNKRIYSMGDAYLEFRKLPRENIIYNYI